MKIAFCFYGQVRYLEGFNLFYNYIKDTYTEYDIDFYIATWNDFNISQINFYFKDSVFLDENKITKNWGVGNTRKMSYLYREVAKLKQNKEIEENIKYKAVVALRPDIIFNPPQFFSKLKEFEKANFISPTVSLVGDIEQDEYGSKIHEDWIYIFTSEAYNIHSTFYSFFYVLEKYKELPIKYKEGGHWIHAYYFFYNKFNIVKNWFPTIILRPTIQIEKFRKHYKDTKLVQLLVGEANRDTKILTNLKDKIV